MLTINQWYYGFHSVDYTSTHSYAYCSIITADSQFWSSEVAISSSVTQQFDNSTTMIIGSGDLRYGCCKLTNVIGILQYLSNNYVLSLISDLVGMKNLFWYILKSYKDGTLKIFLQFSDNYGSVVQDYSGNALSVNLSI